MAGLLENRTFRASFSPCHVRQGNGGSSSADACVQSRRTENLHRGAGGGNRTLTLLLRADFGSGRASRLTFGVRLTLASTKSAANQPTCIVVPGEGIEPSLCCQNWILSPARLPIPPSRLIRARVT